MTLRKQRKPASERYLLVMPIGLTRRFILEERKDQDGNREQLNHNIANLIHKRFVSKDPPTLLKALLVYVRPVLEYASSVWSPQPVGLTRKIESVQRRFTKRFYPRGASSARVIAMMACLSVCLSHAGIVSKRLNVGSRKQHRVIDQGL